MAWRGQSRATNTNYDSTMKPEEEDGSAYIDKRTTANTLPKTDTTPRDDTGARPVSVSRRLDGFDHIEKKKKAHPAYLSYPLLRILSAYRYHSIRQTSTSHPLLSRFVSLFRPRRFLRRTNACSTLHRPPTDSFILTATILR